MNAFPPPLHKGDLIRVVSPAGPVNPVRLNLGIEVLESWGYRVEIAQYALNRDGYLAGSDDERLSDLISALIDPKVKCVICSRGGYGSVRLLSKIPWNFLAQQTPKIFIGFSDIGAIQLVLYMKSGWGSFSGPQVMTLGDDVTDRTADHLRGMLEGNNHILAWKNEKFVCLHDGSGRYSEGVVIPCCLSMLVSLIGTDYFPDLKNVILCIEDINEPAYKIERMFWQLISSGGLTELKALVIGRFLFNDKDICEQVERIVLDLFGHSRTPIWTGLPYGHVQDRLTVPVGMLATIDNEGQFTLSR